MEARIQALKMTYQDHNIKKLVCSDQITSVLSRVMLNEFPKEKFCCQGEGLQFLYGFEDMKKQCRHPI